MGRTGKAAANELSYAKVKRVAKSHTDKDLRTAGVSDCACAVITPRYYQIDTHENNLKRTRNNIDGTASTN